MPVDYIYNRGDHDLNEDNYLIKDNLFAVFDGAGSLNKYVDAEGRTGGFIASNIAKDVFDKNNKSLKELAVIANKEIKSAMQSRDIDTTDKLNLWCTNFAAIKIEENIVNWAQISDATIIFIFRDDSYQVINCDFDYDQETMIKWKQLADQQKANIRQLLDDQLKSVRRKINITYGFLTGEPEMAKFIKEGQENIDKIKHIILFTDGFYLPKKNPEAPDDWGQFIKMYLEGGIQELANHIRTIEESDPKCWTYPRGKQHDDMTAISITM
ncbi:MAG: protein phosphatase 2C domain-containing protein [Patescibacteria group bacterium]